MTMRHFLRALILGRMVGLLLLFLLSSCLLKTRQCQAILNLNSSLTIATSQVQLPPLRFTIPTAPNKLILVYYPARILRRINIPLLYLITLYTLSDTTDANLTVITEAPSSQINEALVNATGAEVQGIESTKVESLNDRQLKRQERQQERAERREQKEQDLSSG